MASFNQKPKNSQDQDVQVDVGDQSVSCLGFDGINQPASNALIVGSWDTTLSVYDLSQNRKYASLKHDAAVLCCDFAYDNVTTFSAGCDGNVRMWKFTDPPTSASIIGRHDGPIRCLKFVPEHNLVVTGSWDKSIRIWDCRSPQPVSNTHVSERVYAMDVKNCKVVVGTADKHIHAFDDIRNMTVKLQFPSPLQWQTRCISIFNDLQGFAIGCIEGRVQVEYFNEIYKRVNNTPKASSDKSFAFKCHRHESDIYTINAIDFHPHNTFCTGGSDGVFCWWDKDVKHRLGTFEKYKKQQSISSVKFNPAGNVMAYALSYDWSKGASGNPNPALNKVFIHRVDDSEIRPKSQTGGVSRR